MIKLGPMQLEMVLIIKIEFEAAGLGRLFEAAVVNAYAESRLKADAVGDHGHAVGLFQLNDATKKAAGYGMTVAARKDPIINTRKIITLIRGVDGGPLRLMADSGSSVDDLVVEFAHSIERCDECGWHGGDAELIRRREMTWQLFPLPYPPRPPDLSLV